jgi:hypothetical protein
MSDNTPTQRFDAPVPPESEVVEEEKKNRGLMIALIAIGAVILIAIIILLIVLLGGHGKPVAVDTKTPTPTASSASPTPSATPTPTPTPTPTTTTAPPPPPPPSTSPSITGYTISPKTLDCSGGTPNLSIHWSSVNGLHAYFGVNADDAMTMGMGWVLPPTGSDADFPDGYHPFAALCGNASTEYTITILGTDGTKVSKKFTVTKQN